MNPTKANLINGLVLVLLGFFNYINSVHPTTVGLIPPVFGIIFIATTPMLKKNKQWIYFSIIGLNVLLLGLFTGQFLKIVGDGNEMRFLSRLGTMFFSCLVAAVVFVKYYFDNEAIKEDAKFPFKVKNMAKEREAAPPEVYIYIYIYIYILFLLTIFLLAFSFFFLFSYI